jgi:predicted nuclease of predicted toxin-antitoxin system
VPLKIYLDDDVAGHTLKDLLIHAGFHVKEPSEAGLLGRQDKEHFEYAKANGYVLLTKNPSDYLALHDRDPDHSGIIGIYQDNDVRRDMGFRDIVAALKQVVRMKVPLGGNFIILNQYRPRQR